VGADEEEAVFRRLSLLAALCVLVPEAVRAQGGSRARELEEQRQLQRIRELARELRELPAKSPLGIARPGDQKRILAEIAKVGHPQAARTLIGYAGDPDYAQLREELLRMLVAAPGADEAQVSALMREHMAPDDPARRIARDYLLALAKRRRKDEWLEGLFDAGTVEDRFLALQGMGDIGSASALEFAATLAKDRSWKPDPSGLVSCGTIAMSVRNAEGQPAARLLLLLTKDPRFGPADAARLREATRLWHQNDLRSYVKLADLAHGDPLTRRETAAFLGTVGLESARAPLVRVAWNSREHPEVRAAAAAALGGLRIAKEDLAEQLKPLLADPEPLVRRGAQDGLGRLMVKPAADAFVSMLDGPFGDEIRQALHRLTGLPTDTDWRKWLPGAFQPSKGRK
jgi:hypothetical protein